MTSPGRQPRQVWNLSVSQMARGGPWQTPPAGPTQMLALLGGSQNTYCGNDQGMTGGGGARTFPPALLLPPAAFAGGHCATGERPLLDCRMTPLLTKTIRGGKM